MLVYIFFVENTLMLCFLFESIYSDEIPMRLEHYFKALPLEEHIFT